MFQLRDYQTELDSSVVAAWSPKCRNVLATLPTGGGKTVVFSHRLASFNGYSVAIAHRQELVFQISLSLARFGLHHRVIAPSNIARACVRLHQEKLGQNFVTPNARVSVAGVRTLLNWAKKGNLKHWLPMVGLWVMDEAHHVLIENEWGRATELFPNAYGLGVTATAGRADGKGLGAHADGVFHTMVEGPAMRTLIDAGHLCDYIDPATGRPDIVIPPQSYSREGLGLSKDGDINLRSRELKTRVAQSHIVGDIVDHYIERAAGKLGVTFVESVDTASKVAADFNTRGIPAAVVSVNTPDADRREVIKRFERREIMQLVNVDIFGEGFDLPGIEVISMGRPTESLGLYMQQFGRVLRPMPGKTHAKIIDHVGNVQRHKLPDRKIIWSLDRREKRRSGPKDPDQLDLKKCSNCTSPYEPWLAACPWCRYKPEPAQRSGPQFVDGDLCELTLEALAELRGDVDKNQENPHAVSRRVLAAAGGPASIRAYERQAQKIAEIKALQCAIAWWAASHRDKGRSDSEIYRRFYLRFGVDVSTAQTQSRADTQKMKDYILGDLQEAVA